MSHRSADLHGRRWASLSGSGSLLMRSSLLILLLLAGSLTRGQPLTVLTAEGQEATAACAPPAPLEATSGSRPERLADLPDVRDRRPMVDLVVALGGFLDENSESWGKCEVKAFRNLADALKEEETRQTHLGGSIAVGLSRDSTPDGKSDLTKLNLNGKVERGSYPHEFEFEAQVGVQLKADSFQENVTNFRATYQYWPERWIETYAFAQRFSDNFLSIDQRYEVGGGYYFGADLLSPRTGKTEELRTTLEDFRPIDAAYLKLKEGKGSSFRHAGKTPKPRDLEDLEYLRRVALQSLRRRTARLSLGIALSVFAEIEQARITPEGVLDRERNPVSFSPTASQRLRWTVRPTIRLRPTGRLKISILPYFKFPFTDWRSADGEIDFRIDFMSRLDYLLKSSETIGGETVSLTLRYDVYYDNVPPRLTRADVPEDLPDEFLVTAEDRHELLVFQVTVGW